MTIGHNLAKKYRTVNKFEEIIAQGFIKTPNQGMLCRWPSGPPSGQVANLVAKLVQILSCSILFPLIAVQEWLVMIDMTD